MRHGSVAENNDRLRQDSHTKGKQGTRNLGVPSETLTFNSDQIGRAGTTNLSELRRVVDF